MPPVPSQEGSAPRSAAPLQQPSLREPSQQWLSEKTPVEEGQYDKPEDLFMIITDGFKPRRQGLCPLFQPPAAVLSSSPPVPSKISITTIISFVRSKQDDHGLKKSASQSLSALSGASKMIMVSKNRHHNRQHCQVDQSLDLQLSLPLQPLHQLPAPPLLLLHPLLAPHLNKVMRIGGPFLVLSRSG